VQCYKKIVSYEMQDNEETCPCGHSLDECKCRQGKRGTIRMEIWEVADIYKELDGLEQFPEWQALMIASWYREGTLDELPEGVTVRAA
jgi:hypothetical protein